MTNLGTVRLEEQPLTVTHIDLHNGRFNIHAHGLLTVHMTSGTYVCVLFDPEGNEVAVGRHTIHLNRDEGHPGDCLDLTWKLRVDSMNSWTDDQGRRLAQ